MLETPGLIHLENLHGLYSRGACDLSWNSKFSRITKWFLYLFFFQKTNPTTATITNRTRMLPTTPPVMTAWKRGKKKDNIVLVWTFMLPYTHLMLLISPFLLSSSLSFLSSSFFIILVFYHSVFWTGGSPLVGCGLGIGDPS